MARERGESRSIFCRFVCVLRVCVSESECPRLVQSGNGAIVPRMASSSRENASDLMLVYPSCHEGALKLCTHCDSR